jgi:hypothetical protein
MLPTKMSDFHRQSEFKTIVNALYKVIYRDFVEVTEKCCPKFCFHNCKKTGTVGKKDTFLHFFYSVKTLYDR